MYKDGSTFQADSGVSLINDIYGYETELVAIHISIYSCRKTKIQPPVVISIVKADTP